MVPNIVSAASVLLLCSLEASAAVVNPSPPVGIRIPMRMRSPTTDINELGLMAKAQREAVVAKYYSRPLNQKRATGYTIIGDQQGDSTYYGSLAIGTPPVAFDVILDTGSSDLWLAASTCGAPCNGSTGFDPSGSSTFKNLSTPLVMHYGSGSASGYLAEDIVQMAGFNVSNQTFGVVNKVEGNILSAPLSGLLGLAWQTIASSGAMPFWQTLASNGSFDSPLFAFQMRRYGNVSNAASLEPGGELTLGYTNSSLYTGSIEYLNILDPPNYWLLPLTTLTVQGNVISIDNASTSAAIDTGTTNISGPKAAVQAIYAQIPNSTPGTGNWAGYYLYPCSTSVTVSFSFGGQNWTMSPADFQTAQVNSTMCVGPFFETESMGGKGIPPWIIGASFLKNVYTVYRYNPPSVGFAALSPVAIGEDGVSGTAPTPTYGTAPKATVQNGASSLVQLGNGRGAAVGLVGALVTTAAAFWML